MRTVVRGLWSVASVAVMAMVVTVPTMPVGADVGACKDRCLTTGVRCATACDVKCNDPGRADCLRDCQAACRTAQKDCEVACDGS